MEKKLDDAFIMTRKMYRAFVITGIITVALFVLPLIGLVFVIPSFISTYSNIGSMANSIP